LLRLCVLAVVPAYLLFSFLLWHGIKLGGGGGGGDADGFVGAGLLADLPRETREHRSRTDREERGHEERTAAEARERAARRLRRTRPVSSLASSPSSSDRAQPHDVVLLADQHERRPASTSYAATARQEEESEEDARKRAKWEKDWTRTATLEEICGYAAQQAFLERPANFLVRDALMPPSPRAVRVLITGVLSAAGFRLALALQERCGVDVVVGFDAMYPNSIGNRLRLQELMAALARSIPKFMKPLFISYLGLDPYRHTRNFQILPSTGELDVIATLKPTHVVHLASHEAAAYRCGDPDWVNHASPYRGGNLHALKAGQLSMEQILAAAAGAEPKDRPHILFASSRSSRTDFHGRQRQMDEMLADFYYQQYNVTSVALRLPDIYGPWGHPESSISRMMDAAVRGNTNMTAPVETKLDLLFVDDAVDVILAAMQYRPQHAKPAVFEISSGEEISLRDLERVARDMLDEDYDAQQELSVAARDVRGTAYDANTETLKRRLGWSPRVSLRDGLASSLAWHLDRIHPYGPPRISSNGTSVSSTGRTETGDMLLRRLGVAACGAEDLVCRSGRPVMPCASECSISEKCVSTVFDDLIPLVQELTEECDVVLYTQNLDINAQDLTLHAEYMEEGEPLVCNFAFIAGESKLAKTVIEKVPDDELSGLGFFVSPEDSNHPGAIRERKYEKLNGRLLYRGWILIWTKETPSPLPVHEQFLLKLSPGRLFHSDAQAAVFIDQDFGVSPKADDIQFLVHEMYRRPWGARIVKRKQRPKAKFVLPAEPERRASVLMSELKYQDSSESERLPPDEKISTYEATRFMRFSNGEEPLGKEPPEIKAQREFYDRLRTTINPDFARNPNDPLHKFEMTHWARSRWVAHDLSRDESRQLRCEWYHEHIMWGSSLDQLSFAYVMAKLELDRKLAHNEPDETAQKHLSEKTEMKKLLSDTFEWHALKTEQNKLYSPFEEMQVLPYDLEHVGYDESEVEAAAGPTPLFVRIISDRIMAYARKAWNRAKAEKAEEEVAKDATADEL
jgi:nucleoside-diphosphate-sugar epimerase